MIYFLMQVFFFFFFLKSVNVLNAKLSPVAFFKLIGIVDAIPSDFRVNGDY